VLLCFVVAKGEWHCCETRNASACPPTQAVVPHLISMNVKGLIEVMSFDIDDLYKSIGARSDAENRRGRAPAIGTARALRSSLLWSWQIP
jgi:hypothetical protein